MTGHADDLAAFLAARADELEAAAKAWQSPPWGEDATNWRVVGQREQRYDNGRSETFTVIDVSGRAVNWAEAVQVRWDSNGERAVHIALNDPHRALALARFMRAVADDLTDRDGDTGEGASASRAIALWLARVWDDHPDFAPKWNPA